MNIEKLKNTVAESNKLAKIQRMKEEAEREKATPKQEQSFEEYLKTMEIESVKEYFNTFVKSIKNISDDALQEVIESTLTSELTDQKSYTIDIKFILKAPKINLIYCQGEDDDGWLNYFDCVIDKDGYENFNEYKEYGEQTGRVYQKVFLQFTVNGPFTLFSNNIPLIVTEDYQFGWQDEIGYFTSNEYYNHVCAEDNDVWIVMYKVIEYLRNSFIKTTDDLVVDGFEEINKEYNASYFTGFIQLYKNILKDALVERLTDFGLKVIDRNDEMDGSGGFYWDFNIEEDTLRMRLSVKNPLF